MRTAQRPKPAEADLWQAHLGVLRQALLMRQPDARAQITSEITRLEREIEAMQARLALVNQAETGEGGALAQRLANLIAERLRQVSDLAGLARRFGTLAKSDESGPTAEAATRPASSDPIEMLHGKGKLDQDQLRAAREIAWVYEAITRAGRARVSRLSEIDPPKGWQEMSLPERAALIHAKRFLPWAERLRAQAPETLDIVLRVVVLGAAIYPVARKHRIGWATCVAKLADGLDEYWRRSEDGARR
jgi:hypothetical protein